MLETYGAVAVPVPDADVGVYVPLKSNMSVYGVPSYALGIFVNSISPSSAVLNELVE